MIVADLVAGDSVFLDSNILIYHFGPHPTLALSCSQLVQRIENKEIQGFTSSHVLGEVGHQLMIMEASKQLGWTTGKVKRRLQRQSVPSGRVRLRLNERRRRPEPIRKKRADIGNRRSRCRGRASVLIWRSGYWQSYEPPMEFPFRTMTRYAGYVYVSVVGFPATA